jgi:SAM-dependent methyltransferase
MASHERFGFEWNKYSELTPEYEGMFEGWIQPLTPNDFKEKTVLDAGCGMGRNSYWCLKWGAKHVTAFDLDNRSLAATRKTLEEFKEKISVENKNIYDIPWENEFDIVFSVGVIHHLKEPEKALKSIAKALKPGGDLIIWVYGYEGYEWIVKYINPIRKMITSKMPLWLVHIITYFFSIPLWIFVKITRGPSPYLKQISKYKFWHIHSIAFDQLIPEVANYWKKEEVEALLKTTGLTNITVRESANKCGWAGHATKNE